MMLQALCVLAPLREIFHVFRSQPLNFLLDWSDFCTRLS